ncbi:pentatricopeptide repeat-containing protein [Tanacetum coccineum]
MDGNWVVESWFLDLLGDDLDMPTGNGLTLMLNQHKGLLEAVKEVMPHAEHRQCARHIYKGFRKQYSGVEFRCLSWAASKATFWHVIPTGGQLFDVRNGSKAFGVDEQRRTCTCRLWQLSGLPCPHAIVVIFKLNRRVEEYVPTCFRRQSFHASYHQYLTPVGGMTFWPDCSAMSRVLPPKPKKMLGRPRKKRIRAAHENNSTTKVSRTGITMTCSNFFKKGHNRNGCKNPTVVKPPKPPCKKGWPKKEQVGVSSLFDELHNAPVVDEQVVDEPQNAPVVDEHVVDEPQNARVIDEHSSQFKVSRSSDGRSNIHKASKRINSKSNRGGFGKRGKLAPGLRFSRLGSWFGLGQGQLESDPSEASENAQTTQSIQTTKDQGFPEQDQQAAPRPRTRLNFIIPRPRSERIKKRKMAKNVSEIGSSSSNAHELK